MQTFLPRSRVARPGEPLALNSMLLLGILLVVVPWAIILVDAIALGLNFMLGLTMLMVFSVGLLFMAAIAPEA